MAKALLAVAALLLAACATPPPVAQGADELGVKVEAVRLSAAGYMLDVRYRVINVEKARPLFDRKLQPMLREEGTDAGFTVPDTPTLGQLRTISARNVVANRSYSILFANPGRYLQHGAKIALLVGDTRIGGLTVE
jgi:hypothetical protein